MDEGRRGGELFAKFVVASKVVWFFFEFGYVVRCMEIEKLYYFTFFLFLMTIYIYIYFDRKFALLFNIILLTNFIVILH